MAQEGFPSCEDLFSTLPTQVGVVRKKWIEVNPTQNMNASSPIDFEILCGENEQILPCGIKIAMAITVRDKETKQKINHALLLPVTAQRKDTDMYEVKHWFLFSYVEGLGHSLFRDIQVSINDTLIDGGDTLYPYRGAFDNRLFTTLYEKRHKLPMNGYNFDETNLHGNKIFGEFSPDEQKENWEQKDVLHRLEMERDRLKLIDEKYELYYARFRTLMDNDFLYFVDTLYTDICQQPKPLPPGSKMHISLTRNSLDFCLLADRTYPKREDAYIHFEYCKLIVPIIELEPKIVKEMWTHAASTQTAMQYPIRSVSLQSIPKGIGMIDLSIDNILQGIRTPRRIFVALVMTKALNGDIEEDPFNFQLMDLEEMICTLGGQVSALPNLRCSNNHDICLPVVHLQKSLGEEQESGITMETFRNRNAIFCFDMTGLSGKEYQDYFMKEITEPTGLHIRLRNPKRFKGHLVDISVIIYKEFDGKICITPSGEVYKYPD